VERLDWMGRAFTVPYIIFYPVVSKDGLAFPINWWIQAFQDGSRGFNEEWEELWRGNIVIAKYQGDPFRNVVDMCMADFVVLKNHFINHGCPQQLVSLANGFSLYLLSDHPINSDHEHLKSCQVRLLFKFHFMV
jgi:hypothetical protein